MIAVVVQIAESRNPYLREPRLDLAHYALGRGRYLRQTLGRGFERKRLWLLKKSIFLKTIEI